MNVTTFDLLNTFGTDGKTKMLQGAPAVNQCLKTLLLAERGELFGDPVFGMNFKEYGHRLNTYVIRDMVSDEITRSILRYDARIESTENELSNVEATVIINVGYRIKTETGTVTIQVSEEV